MDAVEEVKSRLNIEDVIGEYVTLKRAGRNFRGLSPFSNEKTPSFMVSPEKGIWHDFSSGKGGNVFSFIMEVEGLDFKAALELLARKAGIDITQYRTNQNGYDSKLKTRVLQILELATKFYQTQLIANNSAAQYAISVRKMSKQTLLAWKIGYSPNTGRALTEFLTKHGFSLDEMKRSGLVTERRHGAGDMFRARLMIPLCDGQGVVVGFTARQIIDEPDSPKYINTPQTIVYDKGRQVFGLHLAKEKIRKDGFVVVVEGNLDVITSWQAGVTNVVASAGTAMTEQHLKSLSRFSGDIRLCFDADAAGIAATERVIPLAQKVGVELSIISLKDAKDPDELIHKDVHMWRSAVANKQFALDWLVERYQALYDLKTASGKSAFTDELLQTIRRLSEPIVKEHYIKKIAELTDTSIEAMLMKLEQKPSSIVQRKKNVKPQELISDKKTQEYRRLQDHLLAMMLMQPKLRNLIKVSDTKWFGKAEAGQVYKFLTDNPDFKDDPKVAKQLQSVSDYVKIIALQYEELYQELEFADLEAVAYQLKNRLVRTFVQTEKQRLVAEMQLETDQKKLKKLIIQVDKLNILLKSAT